MTVLRRLAVFVLLGALAAPAAAQDDPIPVRATDLYKIRQLSDVTVSPGGRRIVYEVKRALQRSDSAGGPTYRTHLYLADASGRNAPRQLTFGSESARAPAWHPSGNRLAFVRTVEGPPQIFILPMTGGEAYQITDTRHGATNPRFSPDGTHLLYTARLSEKALREEVGRAPKWPSERPGRSAADLEEVTPDPNGSIRQVRAYLAQKRAKRPRVFNRLDLQGERDLEPSLSYRHLFVIDVPSGPPEGAMPEPTMITSGFHSFSGGRWLPGGQQIVLSGAPLSTEHPDRVRQSSLYLARADGSRLRELLSMEGYALSRPRPSPNGQHLAFQAYRLQDAGYTQAEIGLYPMDGSAPPRLLTRDFDRSAGTPKWSNDGWNLYAIASSEGGFPLYRLAPFASTDSLRRQAARFPSDTVAAGSLKTSALETPAADPARSATIDRLTSESRGVRSFDLSRGSVFYVVTEPENPYELYANTRVFDRERRLTAHNASWLKNRRLARPQPFTVRSDSFTVDGWTMRPTTDRKGDPAPLLVEIHGGPSAMWGPGEATMWHEFQYFAAQGYAIVYANPRGSGGYGSAFRRANYRDWGRGPTADVMAAADYAAALPWTDTDRQVVTGGSYAGYLTAWIVAHTDRFRAAVAQRGVYDLTTFLGEGNAWRLVPWHFGGYPWQTDVSGEPSASPAPLLATGSGPPDPDSASPLPRLTFDREAFLRRTRARTAGDTTTVDTTTVDTTTVDSMTVDSMTVDSMTVDSMAADTAAVPEGPRFASPREALIQNSPITFVDQITTPLLIMHADEDLRTGPAQSEMLYKSLKILERPVEYVRYPDAGHDLSRTGNPAQRLDRLLRIWEFFERFIR